MKQSVVLVISFFLSYHYGNTTTVIESTVGDSIQSELLDFEFLKETMPLPAKEEYEELFGSRLTRSVTLLSASNSDRHLPIKILLYGQSIVGSEKFTIIFSDYLKEHFPYADITIENRAIGGFQGQRLVRTFIHDVYDYYPDLIVFHDYEGENHGEIDQILAGIRRNTTADILLFNHHINGDQETYIESSYQHFRYLANKYNCEFADVSKAWEKYLSDNNIEAKELLGDNVHPNEKGYYVLTQILGKHLRYNSLFPSNWQEQVRTVYIKTAYASPVETEVRFAAEKWDIIDGCPTGESSSSPLKIEFEGNRVDIVAGNIEKSYTPGSATLILDGVAITETKGLYSYTRPSSGPNTWWPLIKRIGHSSELIPETWTFRVDSINSNSTVWFFSVTGSTTGFDGYGRSDEAFISNSGRVVIEEPQDYMFRDIKKTFKTVTPVGFECTWVAEPQFIETYQSPEIKDNTKVYKTVVIKGLKNGTHTLEVIPNGDGLLPIEAFEIHRPYNY